MAVDIKKPVPTATWRRPQHHLARQNQHVGGSFENRTPVACLLVSWTPNSVPDPLNTNHHENSSARYDTIRNSFSALTDDESGGVQGPEEARVILKSFAPDGPAQSPAGDEASTHGQLNKYLLSSVRRGGIQQKGRLGNGGAYSLDESAFAEK